MENILEIKRKLFHIIGGFLLIAAIYLDWLNTTRVFLLLCLTAVVSYVCTKTELPGINWFLKQFERDENIRRFPAKGLLFFLVGIFIVMRVFNNKDITIAALMVLSLGDSISYLVGMRYGRIMHPFSSVKYIEGHLAGATAAFLGLVAANYFGLINITILEALLASVIAMFIEGVELEFKLELLDDNIVVQFIAALVIWLL